VRRLTPSARKAIYAAYGKTLARTVRWLFFMDLIEHTGDFGRTTWLGVPIWQNILDLWTIQETIVELKPDLIIECGTFRGGSSLFWAHLMDHLDHGRVITIDIARLHEVSHPRVTYLLGSTLDERILTEVRSAVAGSARPVMVILDDDHLGPHVAAELEAYSPFVSPGSYLLVQDGVIDALPTLSRLMGDTGPLHAIRGFLPKHPEFEVDREKCERFLITHHPMGWLRKRASS
jgi:cephalosporin hydroxylase